MVRTNPVILRPGTTIGSIDAESDDEYLFSCFVDHPAVGECLDVASPAMILAGRTGSGKTAIIRYIASRPNMVCEIDPAQMALSYVANSDILRFLHSLGADLDLFFQVLWKHVLCIEIIRLRYAVNNETTSKDLFTRFRDFFRNDERKKRSLQYLREYEGRFWITMDQNIKEITKLYEDKILAGLGIDIEAIKTSVTTESRMSAEEKVELVSRVRKIINADQLTDLNGVIQILAEIDGYDDMRKYYVLIDRLDERWVDDSIRFRLIRALIESLRAFRKIQDLKIILALRSDVLERVIQETTDLGFQREKYDTYFVRLQWNKDDLLQLVQKRVNQMFRKKYTTDNIFFEDIFSHNVGQVTPFNYILERTLMRPRDVITFVNQVLERARGRYEVTPTAMREAEREYSRIRKQALEEEWRSAFPSLNLLLNFLANRKGSLPFREIADDDNLESLAYSIGVEERKSLDPLYPIAIEMLDKVVSKLNFARQVISILYRVGAIGIKLRPDERVSFAHLDQPIVAPTLIPEDCRVRVHPMLHSALNIR